MVEITDTCWTQVLLQTFQKILFNAKSVMLDLQNLQKRRTIKGLVLNLGNIVIR